MIAFRNILLVLPGTVFLSLPAQEKSGIVNSNYHPVSSIHFNPASLPDNRTYMQLNLAGLNVWARSNAVFIPNFSFWSFAAAPGVPPVKPTENKRSKFVYLNFVADGPAFTISKNRFGLGVFTRGRTVADLRRVPYQFADMLFETGNDDSDQNEEFSFRNARLSNMSWLEYGLSAGYMLYAKRNEIVTGGINIKRLTGLNLLFLNLEEVQGYYTPFGTHIAQLSGKYRSAPFAFGAGKGWGTDLGIIYRKMLKHVDAYRAHSKKSHCRYVDYKYKLGLSLRDAGYISFRSSTVKSQLNGEGDFASDDNSADEFERRFSTEKAEGEKITALTPMALSGSFDYNFENDFYLAIDLNKNLVPNRATGVQSMDYIAIVPRYETKLIEVALPLSVQRYIYPQLGLAFRFRSFVLGFDNVIPLVMRRNTSSMGVYFNLALSLFRNPACGTATAGKVDDCGHYRNPKRKIKRKNSLLSPRPNKASAPRKHPKRN